MVYFGYNGLGERTHKWWTTLNTTTETQYTLDVAGGLPHVIVETSEGQTSRYLTGLAQQQDNFWAYQHPDAAPEDGRGSVRHLSDASAEVTLLQSYDPFGNPVEQSGPGSSGFGYTGEQEDANTGLVFLRARYYDPSTGRFVSKDPFEGWSSAPYSQHPYQYGYSNPINYVDPRGLNGCLLYGPSPYDKMLNADCTQSGGGGIVTIGLGILLSGGTVFVIESAQELLDEWTNVGNGVGVTPAPAPPSTLPLPTGTPVPQEILEELADVANEAWANPAPDNNPAPAPKPTPILSVPYFAQPSTIQETCTPTPEPEADYIWRGIQKFNPATGDFHPRSPQYNLDGSIVKGREGDIGGLSFFEGRMNMWRETAAYKNFRVGFTEVELGSAGFSVEYDGGQMDTWTGKTLPQGHVSVKRKSADEWNDWLHRVPDQTYSMMLRDLARTVGRVETNDRP